MAQTPSPAAELGRAVDAAWQRAVQAEEARGRGRVAAARQSAAAAWLPEAPSVELEQRTGDGGLRETEVAVAAPVWWAGQRAAARDLAEAEQAVAEAATRAARWMLAGEVRELAWALAIERAERAAVADEQETLRALADDVRRRVAAGDLAPSDALAADAEALAADAAIAELDQRVQAAAARWATLTGVAPVADPLEPAAHAAPTDHPGLAAARLALERAERAAAALRRARRDAPEVALSWREERGGTGEARERSVGVALRIPLGTDAGRVVDEAAALAEADLARVQLERAAEQQAVEQRIARDALEAAGRQLEAADARAALLRERARLLDVAFRAGETSLPDLLRARGAAAQAHAALARRRAALGLARARLHQSMGSTP